MTTIETEEEVFIGYLKQWQETGRSLVTLPTIAKNKLELKLAIVSIDNTKLITLNKTFYSYGSVMGYYGQLLDQLTDESD
ncbi:hypothetical protein [Rheinheimera sp.]|uniref:hypothetical protein n=1 Tax=Rheinheimera sp. TaxID=1869214 RepID=UPI0027B9DF98|nr:hypothetical protein [Rheinheimera sp.]